MISNDSDQGFFIQISVGLSVLPQNGQSNANAGRFTDGNVATSAFKRSLIATVRGKTLFQILFSVIYGYLYFN